MKNVIFIAMLACGLFGCAPNPYVINLSQQQIQEKLDEAFPIEKEYLVVFMARLSHPEVMLQEGSDRITFGIEASTNVDIKQYPVAGQGWFSGGIRYDAQSGAFFIQDANIETLVIEGLPDKYRIPLEFAASLAVREYLNRHPVYTLNPAKFKHSLAKLALQNVVIANGQLKITLGLL